jgi:hypothetical protein
MALPPDFEQRVVRELFALEAASTPIVRAVVSACGLDLRTRTRVALHLQQADAPAAVPTAARWSGDVIVRLHADVLVWVTAALLDALLAKAPVRAASQQLPARVPIAQALAHRRVGLEVTLAGCELEFGTLRALQPGDVLPTEHGLFTPVEVRAGNGQPLFAATLVRSGDFRAIEIASATPTGTEEGAS